jgi:8-oxo-dGTP pyrophosphatase MutT (NUDIX family)
MMLSNPRYNWDTPVEQMELRGRPTVGIAIVCRGRVLTVQSEKSTAEESVNPSFRLQWTLPQGKIEKGETIHDAGVRELTEEVGLPREVLVSPMGRPKMLIDCLNRTPVARKKPGEVYEFKEIFYMVLHAYRDDWVQPGRGIKKFAWVGSPGHLLTLIGGMQETRPTKFQATCAVVNKAREAGLLPWSVDFQLV